MFIFTTIVWSKLDGHLLTQFTLKKNYLHKRLKTLNNNNYNNHNNNKQLTIW